MSEMEQPGQPGRLSLYQCEWARCPHTHRRGQKGDYKVVAEIQPEDHWRQECDKSWLCEKGHEFHHLHLDCATVLGLR